MKKSFHHFCSLAAVLTTSIATAQEKPGAPPRDENPPREVQPPRDSRPERPLPGAPDAGRRGDDRRPDGPRPPRPEEFDQPDGGVFPGGRRDRPGFGERLKSGFPALPAKPQPYLGVATSPLDPALSAQLGFTPGLGLIVEEVIPESPAAKAGVQPLDVIKQVNDQLVSNPAHLAALARHFGKDIEVTLLVLRKGQEQKISVKIGERLMRDPAAMRADIFGGMGIGRKPLEPRGENPRGIGDDPNRAPRDPRDDAPSPRPKPSEDLLREVRPGGAREVQSHQNRVSTTWNTASAKVMLKDANGEIEVRSENGKRTLVAKNPKGETAFEGPIDTEAQREAIPAGFRKMLEQAEARPRIEARPGAHPQAGPGTRAGAGSFAPLPFDPDRFRKPQDQPEVQ